MQKHRISISRFGRQPVARTIVRLIILAALLSSGCSRQQTVYLGGPIITMDSEDRIVEALAVDDDRIAAVGTESDLRAWAKEHGAKIVDLEGRAMLPGFIDAHGHFPGTGLSKIFVDLNSPPISDVESIEDLVGRLTERAGETGSGEWVVGFGYDDSLLAERRHPTRHDLDRVSPNHPVAVLHISGHLAAVNSAGLEELGFDERTPDPEGGLIRRGIGTKTPDGVLEETAFDGLRGHLTPGLLGGLQMMRSASDMYLSQGVTSAQSGATPAELYPVFDWLSWLGVVPLRLTIWPLDQAADEIYSGDLKAPTWDPLRIASGAVKLIGDGSIQGYTGYLSEPYFVPPGDDPSYRGYPRIPRDTLIDRIVELHAEGFQVAVHGNGDASIDDILDGFEAAQNAHPRKDTRHIIIHAQMTRPDQLDRMKTLGIVPSFFSLHTFYWGDRHRTLFMGPERAARMSPAKSARDRGIRFTIHADAPVVPMEPLRLVWSAVNRKTRSGFIIGPDERLPVMAALRAVTIDAAWQHFDESEKGSLEPGKLADLVILSESPLNDPEHIDEIQVDETIIGGETLYRRSDAN